MQNGEGLANMDSSKKKEDSKIISVGDSSETTCSVNVKGFKKNDSCHSLFGSS
jgi:hypothetical protein